MQHSPLIQAARELGQALSERAMMIATAESCTGGMIAMALTELAGSSLWFERGFVSYANRAKSDLLGVAASLIDQHGAVSEEVALAMALGALGTHQGIQFSLSVTGIAGPTGGSAEKPVGLVHIGLSGPGGSQSEGVRFGSS
ncbi:MAG: CinA family protein, partial [Betaproteobacteria bacterium]|nr:CinA family protein [Betaproteobacteria bacterium]